MDIKIELLLRYLKTFGEATISFETNDQSNSLIVHRSENSGVRESLSKKDFETILLINGVHVKLRQLDQELRNKNSNDVADIAAIAEKKEFLIYGTLSKYLTQLVNASQEQNLFPEICSLE